MVKEDLLDITKVTGASAVHIISSVADFATQVIPILTAIYITFKIVELGIRLFRRWRERE